MSVSHALCYRVTLLGRAWASAGERLSRRLSGTENTNHFSEVRGLEGKAAGPGVDSGSSPRGYV